MAQFFIDRPIFAWVVAIFIMLAGAIAIPLLPVSQYPSVAPPQISVYTTYPGASPEDIYQSVTQPIEIAMNSVQKKANVRSVTMFGLSVIKIIFDDGVEDFFARQQVNNQLRTVSLPDGVDPEVQPPYGPTGEIFRYTLESKDRDSRELLTLQNWVIDRQLRSVPGVADVVSFVEANSGLLGEAPRI